MSLGHMSTRQQSRNQGFPLKQQSPGKVEWVFHSKWKSELESDMTYSSISTWFIKQLQYPKLLSHRPHQHLSPFTCTRSPTLWQAVCYSRVTYFTLAMLLSEGDRSCWGHMRRLRTHWTPFFDAPLQWFLYHLLWTKCRFLPILSKSAQLFNPATAVASGTSKETSLAESTMRTQCKQGQLLKVFKVSQDDILIAPPKDSTPCQS